MKILRPVFGSFFFFFLFPALAWSVDFNPQTAAQFQADLTTASTNGFDDTITLPSGNFFTSDNGGNTFLFASAENHSLTIIGAGIDSTILDGNGVKQVLLISNTGGPGADISISGVTIQNGDGMGGFGGGLFTGSDQGDITIENSKFFKNKNTGGSGGGFTANSTDGNINCNNNIINQNTPDVNFGGALCNSTTGAVNFNGNTLDQNTAGSSNGGFFANSNNGNVTCNNNILTTNTASNGSFGGAYCVSNMGDISFVGNTLDNNKSLTGNFGGAIANSGNGAVNCSDNIVVNNQADDSFAGIYCNSTQGAITLANNTITNNKANTGAFGGFYANSSDGAVTCNDNTATQNSAGTAFGGGICNSTAGAVVFMGNTINDNHALGGDYGGAYINTGDASLLVESNTFFGNTTTGNFGGAYVNAGMGDVAFINNIVGRNTSGSNFGGALVNTQQELFIINNTIEGNTAPGTTGGGLYASAPSGDIQLYNNISFGNTLGGMGADIFAANGGGSSVFLFNNDFSDFCFTNPGFSCDSNDLGANQGANKDVDPLFVDAAAGDYRLQNTSPLIDMGTSLAPMLPATDRVGNPRIFGPEPDMGALEAVPQIAVDPLILDYGQVATGNESPLFFTISNLGTFDLNVLSLILSDPTNFILNPNGGPDPCGSDNFVLAGGDSCTIEVIFNPQTEEDFTATVTVNSDDPNDPAIAVQLIGTGSAVLFSGGGCSLGSAPVSARVGWLTLFATVSLFIWIRNRKIFRKN